MLPLAARYILTTLSEASRIMDLGHLEIMILVALATGPERVTAHGLAASLNVPRETCRRRIKALQAAGWIQADRLALPAEVDCPDPERFRECLAMFDRQTRRFSATVTPVEAPARATDDQPDELRLVVLNSNPAAT